jgi:chromosome segregation ATPase
MGSTQRRAKGRHGAAPVEDSGDDLVHILSQLTDDVERFDSIIRDQRRRLEEHRARLAAAEQEQIGRHRRRMRASAEQMVTRAKGAVDQVRGLATVTELHVVKSLGRGPGRREDQPA